MLRRPQDISKVLYYKDLGHEELWLEVGLLYYINNLMTFVNNFNLQHLCFFLKAANRLTAVVQQIIEFAKMVPGFMRLPQGRRSSVNFHFYTFIYIS